MQESSSFWTEIKALEDQLAKTPDSLCFARLSEVYLKMGLADDALYVARRGVSLHPRYLSGQRALARACHAKGCNEEAVAALLVVTEALPEDIHAQKLLGKLFNESGNQEAAVQAFKTALVFAPDDVECRLELNSLLQLGVGKSSDYADDHDDIIEDLEELEELDVVDDEDDYAYASEPMGAEVPFAADSGVASRHDPLSTSTLAELYVSQGFISKALDIYRSMLIENPADQVAASRIAELTAQESPVQIIESSVVHDQMGIDAGSFLAVPDQAAVTAPREGMADNAVAVLDGWLENIRRIKSCR